MLSDSLFNTMLLFGLIFTAAGFVLGLFCNNRRIFQLEDRIMRLKRTVAHLQRKLEKRDEASEDEAIQQDAQAMTGDR